jgi:hypothetical protein
MKISNMTFFSKEHFHGGAFSFDYSKQVLNFCKKIWEDEKLYDSVLGSMKKIYHHLSGREKIWDGSFYIGQSQGNPRWPFFRCPGDCACIGPDHNWEGDEYGSGFYSHNVDTKIQQLTLLAGAIKLANLAREDEDGR